MLFDSTRGEICYFFIWKLLSHHTLSFFHVYTCSFNGRSEWISIYFFLSRKFIKFYNCWSLVKIEIRKVHNDEFSTGWRTWWIRRRKKTFRFSPKRRAIRKRYRNSAWKDSIEHAMWQRNRKNDDKKYPFISHSIHFVLLIQFSSMFFFFHNKMKIVLFFASFYLRTQLKGWYGKTVTN